MGAARRRAAPTPPRRLTPAGSNAVAAFAAAVVAQRAQEVDLAKLGPHRVAEVELGVDGLPEQESGQALLARGTDDQIRVGLAPRVEVVCDVVDVDDLGQLLDG